MTKNHLRVAQGAASDSTTVRYEKLLDVEILPRLERPGRYIGPFEASGIATERAHTTRLALLWPSVPESHHTPASLAPVKRALESRCQLPVELVCVPAPDAVALLSARGLPAFSRPSWIPLPSFEHLLLWIEHPGQLPGVLTLLHLSGLPLRAVKHSTAHPRLYAAGPAAAPLAKLLGAWCDEVLTTSDPVEVAEALSPLVSTSRIASPDVTVAGRPDKVDSGEVFCRNSTTARLGDIPAGELRVRPHLPGAPASKLSQQIAGFGGAGVTRIHLGAASEPLRERLGQLDSAKLGEICAEALGHESGQLEIELSLGLEGESAADRAAIPRLIQQLEGIAPRGARQLKILLGARLPASSEQGIAPGLLEEALSEIRSRLSSRKLRLHTIAASEYQVAAALLHAEAEHVPLLERVHAGGAWHGDLDGSFNGARWDEFLSAIGPVDAIEGELALAEECDAAPTGLESVAPLPPTLDENGHPLRRAEDSRERSDRWRRWSALVPHEYQLRLLFEKKGRLRHLSHREMTDLLLESCRRAGIPLVVAGVVSPRPKLSFGPSLPVGVEGRQEFVDLSLTRKAPGVIAALNEHLPEGLLVRRARYLSPGAKCAHAPVQRARYSVRIPVEQEAELQRGLQRFESPESWTIERHKGGEAMSLDLKSQVTEIHVDERDGDEIPVHFECDLSGEGMKLRPHEFVAALLECPVDDACTLTLHREQLLSRGGEPMGPWRTPMELVELAMRRSRQMVKRYS